MSALRRPDGSATDKAVPLACVLAAELPDLDSLWPASDAVLGVLQAHRGPTHALLGAPVVAAVAAALAMALFRGARFRPLFAFSLASVLFAHLFADLWTGWGTRLLLPFSTARLSLDWTMVVDPFVTLPLLAGAVLAFRRRERWRVWMTAGAALCALYVGGRVVAQTALQRVVAARYAHEGSVTVFPSWVGPWRWRFVVARPESYRAGNVTLAADVIEEAAFPRDARALTQARALAVPTVDEAIAWARFPVVELRAVEDGGCVVRVHDLRYHLRGQPTLAFEVELDARRRVKAARLHRGGSFRELWRRWRSQA